MRPLLIAGILICAISAFLLIRGGRFTSQRNVLEVGDLKVTADEQQTIPPWVAGVGLLAGVGLIVAGARQRT